MIHDSCKDFFPDSSVVFYFVIYFILLNGFVFLILFEYVSLGESYKLNASRFLKLKLIVPDLSRQIVPLKKVRITRPPVSFLKSDDIHQFQAQRKQLRCQAHQIKSEDIRKKFRDVRNLVRAGEEINYQKALSSKSPKYYSARFTESSTPIQTPFVPER